jgi:DNA-binding Lrp family transcriptional regulator
MMDDFDELDGHIMEILVERPRAPYTEIQELLAEKGHDLSTEGIRYRVKKIIESTSVFFLIDPSTVPSEILRVTVRAENEPGAKEEAFEYITQMPFWHISRGMGTFDIFAVGSFPTIERAETVITEMRQHEAIEQVDFILVSERNRSMENYVVRDYLDLG